MSGPGPSARIVVIADELTAAGFRLAGLETRTPAADAVATTFREALAAADLVCIDADSAARVPAAELDAALHALHPLVLVFAGFAGAAPVPDVAREVRRALAVEAA